MCQQAIKRQGTAVTDVTHTPQVIVQPDWQERYLVSQYHTRMAHSHGCGHYPELNHGSGAKWIKNLTKSRLSTFLGGHFQDVNLSSVLYTQRLDDPKYVDLQVWSAPGLSKPLFEEAIQQTFKPAKKGDSFGPSCESPDMISSSSASHTMKRGMTVIKRHHFKGIQLMPSCFLLDKPLVESQDRYPI